MTTGPTFPPLMSGQAVAPGIDPFAKACALAALGSDPGVIVHNTAPDVLDAALILAPEVPLGQAMAVLIACGVGFQNALGALAPPEVAVHLHWNGRIDINGAASGALRAHADRAHPEDQPNWIVVGLRVPFMPRSDAPGTTPDQTCLYDEGCAEVTPTALLESWARHTLHWINRMEQDGNRALHAEWRGLVQGMGEDMTVDVDGETLTGTFMGVDEDFAMLLRMADTTRSIPLTTLLEADP